MTGPGIVAAAWVTVYVIVFALCRAAARGDRRTADALAASKARHPSALLSTADLPADMRLGAL